MTITGRYDRRKRAGVLLSFSGISSVTSMLPYQTDIYQALGRHDVFTLQYPQIQPWMGSLTTGVPLVLGWGNNEANETIYGYVSHVTPTSHPAHDHPVQIVGVGVTWPLKERGTDVWVDMTGPEIVSEIARKFHLQVVSDNHSARLGQVAQAGRSYWEVLLDVADRIGFVVQSRKAALLFRNRDVLIDTGIKHAPVLAMGTGGTQNLGNLPGRTLMHFKPRVGSFVDHARATQVVSGVDPLTGEVIITSANPGGSRLRQDTPPVLFHEYPHDRAVNSLLGAEMLAAGRGEKVRMSVPADATAMGSAGTRPGQPVYIEGTGPSTDGYWVVDSALHTIMAAGEYSMDLKLVTDSLGAPVATQFRPRKPAAHLRDINSATRTQVAYHKPVLTTSRIWTTGGRL